MSGATTEANVSKSEISMIGIDRKSCCAPTFSSEPLKASLMS